MTEEKYGVGVDIGATWIRVAITDVSGKILEKDKNKVKASHSYEVSDQIAEVIEYLLDHQDVDREKLCGIGIASAGPMNRSRGELVSPTNIPLEIVPLARPLEEEFEVPVDLINDGASAVLAEQKFGAGQGLKNLAYVTISTGIGGGAIVDNNLLFGKNGNAAEIGHFTIDMTGRLKCGCGQHGHWEAYCSGSNIPNYVKMRLEEIDSGSGNSELFDIDESDMERFTAKDLYDLAKSGDGLAVQIVDEIGRLNAIGFSAVNEAYDPNLITVGGAVALNNPDLVIDPIRRHMDEFTQNEVPEVTITELEEEIVLYGAIAVALAE